MCQGMMSIIDRKMSCLPPTANFRNDEPIDLTDKRNEHPVARKSHKNIPVWFGHKGTTVLITRTSLGRSGDRFLSPV